MLVLVLVLLIHAHVHAHVRVHVHVHVACACACGMCMCICVCVMCMCMYMCTHRLAEEVLQVHPRRTLAQVSHVQLASRATCGLAVFSHEDLTPVELGVVQLGDRA